MKKRLKKACLASSLWYNVSMQKQKTNNWQRIREIVGETGVEDFSNALTKIKELDKCMSYSRAQELYEDIRDLMEPYAPSKISIIGGTATNILNHAKEKMRNGVFDHGIWLID